MAEGSGRIATVKWFNEQKGFGFVSVAGADDAFVHKSALPGARYRTLVAGEPMGLLRVEVTPDVW